MNEHKDHIFADVVFFIILVTSYVMGRTMRSENDECSFRINVGTCIVLKLFCCCITPPQKKKINQNIKNPKLNDM